MQNHLCSRTLGLLSNVKRKKKGKKSNSFIKTAYEIKDKKIRWSDCLTKDLRERKLKEEDTVGRERQRNTIKSSWAIFMSMESKISCS